MQNSQSAIERRDRLRAEGKIELPLNVDTRKYLLSMIKYRDLIISLPLLILGLVGAWYLQRIGQLSTSTFVWCLFPWGLIMVFLSIPHPDRKNINFLTSKFVWKYKFHRRQKLFVYSKGESMEKRIDAEDIRSQLGIKNVFAGCYETTDSRYVKVINVSSINISLLNKVEEEKVFQSYETFLNDLPRSMFPLQISQISQPINLTNYTRDFSLSVDTKLNKAKESLMKSYLQHADDIQKSKDMVSRNRYVILSRSFNNINRKKMLEELERDTAVMVSQLESMQGGRFKLTARPLDNDELFNLIFTCIDYENAQVNFSFKASMHSPVSVGERTSKEMSENWARIKADHIM